MLEELEIRFSFSSRLSPPHEVVYQREVFLVIEAGAGQIGGDAQDEVEGVVGEGVVRQTGLVQLGADVGFM